MKQVVYGLLFGIAASTAMANVGGVERYDANHWDSSPHISGQTTPTGGGNTVKADNDNQADSQAISGSQTVVQVEASQVANAVSSLALPFCGSGSGGSTRAGSFNIGGSSYSCEVSRLVALMDEHSSNLLKRAKNQPIGSFERNQAIARAAQLQDDIYKILGEDAVRYLHNRGNTASTSTWIRDWWPALLLIGLAL